MKTLLIFRERNWKLFMVSNQQLIAFSSVIFLFATGENSVGIFCRRSTSITEYASKRNSTFCLPFAFCLRRKLKNSAPKPGKAIKLRCQLGWLVEGSQGSWLGEGRGITSCASHTIRARPTPSLISHTNWLRPRGQHEIFMSLAAKA